MVSQQVKLSFGVVTLAFDFNTTVAFGLYADAVAAREARIRGNGNPEPIPAVPETKEPDPETKPAAGETETAADETDAGGKKPEEDPQVIEFRKLVEKVANPKTPVGEKMKTVRMLVWALLASDRPDYMDAPLETCHELGRLMQMEDIPLLLDAINELNLKMIAQAVKKA